MKHPYLLEEVDRDATTLSLRHLGAQPDQEGFDVLLGDVGAGRVGEQGFEGSPVTALHDDTVQLAGTESGSEAYRWR